MPPSAQHQPPEILNNEKFSSRFPDFEVLPDDA
jgi:hypothetical protein